MLNEVNSVVEFISKLFRQRNLESNIILSFAEGLRSAMCNYYFNHWFPERPYKGSAYRCIRNHNNRIDPLFLAASLCVKVEVLDLINLLPKEITIWVDPENVSYRIGEEGSIGVLFEGRPASDINRLQSKMHSCKDQVLYHLQASNRSESKGVEAAAAS